MATTRLALAMGLTNRAPVQYSNYNFNSFARMPDGKVLAFNEDGIFLLDAADTDATAGSSDTTLITSRVKFARTGFGILQRKRIRAMSVGGEFKGSIRFTVSGNEQSAAVVDLQPQDTTGKQTVGRQFLPRTNYGNDLDIEIGNLSGCDFSIDVVDAHIVPLAGM